MPLFTFGEKLLAAKILVAVMAVAPLTQAAAQQEAGPPDFSSNNVGWLTFYVDFSVVPGVASPLHNDPAHPRVSIKRLLGPGSNQPILLPISPAPPFSSPGSWSA